MKKVACYGVRDVEKDIFESMNKYGYELSLYPELLTEDTIETARGKDAVILRANCIAEGSNLQKMKEYGVKYILTRTVGIDHIDVALARSMGFEVAYVPGYSPNAVAELGLSFAMMLVRNTAAAVGNTSRGDFVIRSQYFSRELRNLRVGIIGVGRIGIVSAKTYKGFGAQVFGFDPYPRKDAEEFLEYVSSIDDIARECDVVSIHIPYIKGENHHIIDESFVSKMREGSILINVARGELVDCEAVLDGLASGKIAGFATDVLENEARYFNKNINEQGLDENNIVLRLNALYPRVLITPHLGSSTDEACKNM